jgi:hypothetical protein
MEREKFVFNLGKYGRMFLSLDIKPLNEITMKPISMKVDSGADFTTLSKAALAELGYDFDWVLSNAVTGDEYNLTTAAGDTEIVGLVQLPLANFLGYEATNWPFRVVLAKNRDFRNLLGRDLLAGFDYSFINSRGQFEIERIGSFSPIYDFIAEQSISAIRATPENRQNSTQITE